MANHSWGGVVTSQEMHTDNLPWIVSRPVPMATARPAASGRRPIRVVQLGISFMSGGTLAMNYAGVEAPMGMVFPDSGGSFDFVAARVGGQTLRVGRNRNAPGATYFSDGDSLPGIMPGSMVYQESPTAPGLSTPTLTGPAAVRMTISAPGDMGGLASTGYRVQRSTSPSFNQNVVTTAHSSTTVDIAGLAPGTYYFRATAKNYVTDQAGELGGAWSTTRSITIAAVATGAGEIYEAATSQFVPAAGLRFNAATGQWEEVAGERYNAATSQWEPI